MCTRTCTLILVPTLDTTPSGVVRPPSWVLFGQCLVIIFLVLYSRLYLQEVG